MPQTSRNAGRRITTAAIVTTLGVLVVASLPWDGDAIRETDCWVLPNGRVVRIPS